MLFDFDSSPSRDNTHCYKHDSKSYNNIPLDAIPLWVADMDFESAPCIKETLIHRAAHGIYGYTFTPDAYYEAIINWISTRHQWSIHREWIVPAPNLVTTFNLICQGFLTPTDKVLVQNPVYHPFKAGPLANDMTIAINSLHLVDGHYEIDFDDFEAKVKDPDVKLFILCNPHNPVGRVWTYDELKRMGELCVAHDVLIISDEIHQDIVHLGHHFTSMGTMPEHIANQVFVCTSPGKTFNMPILACGNIIIKNEGLRSRFEAMLKRIAFQDMNPFTIEATITAYTEGAPWVDALLDYLITNITYVRDFIHTHLPCLKVLPTEGTYLLWIDCRDLGLSQEDLMHLLIQDAKLWVHSGTTFGEEGTGFIRMNIASPRATLEHAMHQLKEAIDNKRDGIA